jgi:16S rRNA (guanine1516-N2)-methyltransferase
MSFSISRHDSVPYPTGVLVIVETQEERLLQESVRLQDILRDVGDEPQYILYFGDRGIELKTPNHIRHNGQRVDFSTIDFRVGAGNLSKKQPLPKAIGDHRWVIDATAGFGMDAARLAMMGYSVTAIEQSPILSAMLRDGLWRANQDSVLADALGGRLSLVESNSVQYFECADQAEVIYIDPMFPPKRKKSALPPGHIQALQSLVGAEEQEQTKTLFDAALGAAKHRVVVKRPSHAPQLGDSPVASHGGKLVRYEVYKPNNSTH